MRKCAKPTTGPGVYGTYDFRSVDDTCVIAELEHAEHGGEDCVRQEERQTLQHIREHVKHTYTTDLMIQNTRFTHPQIRLCFNKFMLMLRYCFNVCMSTNNIIMFFHNSIIIFFNL